MGNMIFHDYLQSPKTTEQLVSIAKEHGLDWNESQVELYNLLDPNIYKTESDEWMVKVDNRRKMILEAIEKALEKRPMTKVEPDIMEQLTDIIVPRNEVIDVAISTGRYESPRENIIRLKRK